MFTALIAFGSKLAGILVIGAIILLLFGVLACWFVSKLFPDNVGQ